MRIWLNLLLYMVIVVVMIVFTMVEIGVRL